jgi:hypothetical protein
MQITIGADPELFLEREVNGLMMNSSAFGMIEGTKANPKKVKRGAVQVDGMALEFNINPAKSEAEFCYNVEQVMAHLRRMIPKEYQFKVEPHVYFSEKVLATQPEEALELGCDPDFNAWTGEENPTPKSNDGLRTASGHVHIGWTKGQDPRNPYHLDACYLLVRLLDLHLGLPALLLDPRGGTRRRLYGRAGAFRPKPYGVEYRVLSNFWIKSLPLTAWVYRQTRAAFEAVQFKSSRVKADYVWANNGWNARSAHEMINSPHLDTERVRKLLMQVNVCPELWSNSDETEDLLRPRTSTVVPQFFPDQVEW